jgi:membrane protein
MQAAEIADPEPSSRPPGRRSRARRLLGELVGLYWDSGISDDVPALSWFLLSSLVPLALGITALAAIVLGDYAQAQAVAERVSKVLPSDVHDQVVQLILRTKRDSPLLIAGAIVGMLWTSSGIVGVLSRVLSRLLSLHGPGILIGKLRNIGVTAAVTVLIVVMVAVASAGTGVVRRLDVNASLIRLLLPFLALVVTALICGTVYWSLSARKVRYRSALAGGALAGVILLVTPTAAGYYLRLVAGRTPVELFLMLAGVLITCYLAAFGLLLGAGVTARIDLGHRLTSPQPAAAQSA